MDERRFEPEVNRLLERFGFLTVEPGSVLLKVVGTELVVSIRGNVAHALIGRIPGHRLRAVSRERMVAAFEAALDDYPPHLADQLRVAVAERGMQVEDRPDSDVVILGVDGRPVVGAHRRFLVDGWPADDFGDDEP